MSSSNDAVAHGPGGVRREWESLDESGWVLSRWEVRMAMRGCDECAAVLAGEARRSSLRSAYRRRCRARRRAR